MRIILLKLFFRIEKKNLHPKKIGVFFGVSEEKIFLHQIGIIIMKLIEVAKFADSVGDEAAQDMLLNMGAVSSPSFAKALIAKARKFAAKQAQPIK